MIVASDELPMTMATDMSAFCTMGAGAVTFGSTWWWAIR